MPFAAPSNHCGTWTSEGADTQDKADGFLSETKHRFPESGAQGLPAPIAWTVH
jgi:hypothetical protein